MPVPARRAGAGSWRLRSSGPERVLGAERSGARRSFWRQKVPCGLSDGAAQPGCQQEQLRCVLLHLLRGADRGLCSAAHPTAVLHIQKRAFAAPERSLIIHVTILIHVCRLNVFSNTGQPANIWSSTDERFPGLGLHSDATIASYS